MSKDRKTESMCKKYIEQLEGTTATKEEFDIIGRRIDRTQKKPTVRNRKIVSQC